MEQTTVATMVLARGRQPSTSKAPMASGTFKKRESMPMGTGRICARAVARPEMPPGAMSLGMVNMTRPASRRKEPKTMAAAS